MRTRAWGMIVVGAALVMALGGEAEAQTELLLLDSLVASVDRVESVPFAPREHLRYKVKAGIFSVGEAHMSIGAIDTIDGHTTYPIQWHIKGGVPFYRIDTWFWSWLDTQTLVSRRFVKDQNEGGTHRYREYNFYPEIRQWHRIDWDTVATMPRKPLDDVSMVYYARTLPLVVGETYTLNRYFKTEGNPVVLEVLRKDRKKVGAGTFNTIVVRPVVRTRGLFSEGGEAEIHFSDDERRLVVYMKTRMPGINMTLHLEEILETPAEIVTPVRLDEGGLDEGGLN